MSDAAYVVNGAKAFAATGGRDFDPALPLVIFVHGAALDHTVWALLARWFAHRGFAVLAPDLPGHGRSDGEPLATIGAMADWTAALIEAAGARRAAIIGHSMGSLVALETAARHSEKITAIGLIGAAAAIPVSRDLLAAAEADDHAAIDMLRIWGYGFRAGIGGSLAPGLWMLGGAERLLERARPGVLFTDLRACNDYRDGLSRRRKGDGAGDPGAGRARPDDAGQSRHGARRRLAQRPRRDAQGRRPHADERAAGRGAGRGARIFPGVIGD